MKIGFIESVAKNSNSFLMSLWSQSLFKVNKVNAAWCSFCEYGPIYSKVDKAGSVWGRGFPVIDMLLPSSASQWDPIGQRQCVSSPAKTPLVQIWQLLAPKPLKKQYCNCTTWYYITDSLCFISSYQCYSKRILFAARRTKRKRRIILEISRC